MTTKCRSTDCTAALQIGLSTIFTCFRSAILDVGIFGGEFGEKGQHFVDLKTYGKLPGASSPQLSSSK